MSPKNLLEVNRRQFLVTSAVAGAGVMLSGAPAFAQAIPRVSVGYWDGSDLVPPAALKGKDTPAEEGVPALPVAIIAATGLLHPDPAFLKTDARLRIEPRLRSTAEARERHPFSVWVHYQADGPGSTRMAPFLAWTTDRRGQASPPITFVAPVEADHGILVSILAEAGSGRRRTAIRGESGEAVAEQFVRFVLIPDPAEPKLQRGLYVLAPLPGSSAVPNWDACSWQATEGGRLELFSNGRPVAFDYLVITIDYARSPEQELG